MSGQCTLVVLGWHQSWQVEASKAVDASLASPPQGKEILCASRASALQGEGNLMCQSCGAVRASAGKATAWRPGAGCAGWESSPHAILRAGIYQPLRDHNPARDTLRSDLYTAPAPPLAAAAGEIASPQHKC